MYDIGKLLRVALAWAAAAFASPGADPSASAKIQNPQLSTAAFPKDTDSEESYARWLDQRTEAIHHAARSAKSEPEADRYRLAAANWILSNACEPLLSRWLQGLDAPSDRSRLEELSAKVLEILKTLRGRSAPELVESDRAAALDFLECYTYTFRACWAVEEVDPDQADQARRRLSIYLEDNRPDVAASATLWQAALYWRQEKPERALELLPLAVEPLGKNTANFDFFARLLRCRVLAERRSFAAAWSLLTMIEEVNPSAFPTPLARQEALRTIAFAKGKLCERWVAEVDDRQRDALRSWCDEIARDLQKEHFSGDAQLLLRLTMAVPLVVDMLEFSPTTPPQEPDDAPSKTPHP